MEIILQHKKKPYKVELSEALDISIPIQNGMQNPNCFYAPLVEFSPVRMGDFVGSTAEGGLVNFKNIELKCNVLWLFNS